MATSIPARELQVTLRFVHTADWHLGHQLGEFDRHGEQAQFLDWLAGQLLTLQADALLVAGDLFDAAIAPAAAQRLWFGFLGRLWRDMPHLQVVAIAGNHDNAARLDATEPMLDALGRLHIVGAYAPDRPPVPLTDQTGLVRAHVAAVPYLRPADLALGLPLIAGVRAVYAQAAEQLRAVSQPGQAKLAMGHAYLVGGQVSELSERKIQCGHQDALPVDIFAADLAYVALGHLHFAQAVGGRHNVRYAGSPLPLAMDEMGYRHQVCVVDVADERVAAIHSLAVPRAVPFLRVPELGALTLANLADALAALPDKADLPDQRLWPFAQWHALREGSRQQTVALVEDALKSKAVRVVSRKVEAPPDADDLRAALPDVKGLDELTPADVFTARWQQYFGEVPDAATLSHFHQLAAWAATATDQGKDDPVAKERRDRVAAALQEV